MERRVQELKKVLRALMLGKQATTWDVYLQQTLHTFRNRQNPQPNTDMKFQEQGNGKSPRIRRNGYTKNGKNARESQTTTNILSAKIRTWQTRAENRVKMEGNGVMARVFVQKKDRFEPVWEGTYIPSASETQAQFEEVQELEKPFGTMDVEALRAQISHRRD